MNLPRAPQRITTGFAFSYVGRAILEGIARRQFGKTEMAKIIEFFGEPSACVYCGSQDVKRWDHCVPVKNGGDTILGNMVPACARCDDSKQDLTFEKWMKSDAKYSPKSRGVKDLDQRIQRLHEYRHEFSYAVLPIEERCTRDELEELAEIREQIDRVRSRLEGLLASFQKRQDLEGPE